METKEKPPMDIGGDFLFGEMDDRANLLLFCLKVFLQELDQFQMAEFHEESECQDGDKKCSPEYCEFPRKF